MECRINTGKQWEVFSDPYSSPGALGTLVFIPSAIAVVQFLAGAFLACAARNRDQRRPSDIGYIAWHFLGTAGFGCTAVAAGALVAGENEATRIGKVLIILSWGALLATTCGAVESACPSKILAHSLSIVGLLTVGCALIGVVALQRDGLEIVLAFVSVISALCTVYWCIVHRYAGSTALSENLLRALFCFAGVIGGALSAAADPTCGVAGHADCYERCWLGAAGQHLFMFVAMSALATMTLTALQLCAPSAWGFYSPCACVRKNQAGAEDEEKGRPVTEHKGPEPVATATGEPDCQDANENAT